MGRVFTADLNSSLEMPSRSAVAGNLGQQLVEARTMRCRTAGKAAAECFIDRGAQPGEPRPHQFGL